MKKTLLFGLISILTFFRCAEKEIEIPEFRQVIVPGTNLTEIELYDKILGMMVGSAIGDAMGAPTEMWSREQIQSTYGFVVDLDSMVREASPEGTWLPDLPAGGTTDDTRWKILTTRYLQTQSKTSLNPKDFAAHISKQYTDYVQTYEQIENPDSTFLMEMDLRLNWLSEWQKVSAPFMRNDLTAYSDSLGKFYGGEMVCAGLLYTPALGIFFPGQPEKAYIEAFKLSIYDIGYAKDISALAAAMSSAAMSKTATTDSLKASLEVDPYAYIKSRLVGRSAAVWVREAERIALESRSIDSLGDRLGSESEALNFAFTELDKKLQDMPFHAGEIFLQTLTAMFYADFDLMGTLAFLTNYGRDNDTTAALAGGILGAYVGFDALPEKEKNQVLTIAKLYLDQDLEREAALLTAHMIRP